MARLAELAEANGAIEVIVGLPTTLSGQQGKAALDARAFARGLARRLAPVPVRLLDERFTTVTAHDALRARAGTPEPGGPSWTRPRPRFCCRQRSMRNGPPAGPAGRPATGAHE